MTKNESFEQYALILFVFALFAMVVLPLAQAVALGFLVAMVVAPVYDRIRRLTRGRSHLSASLTTFMFTVGVILPLGLLTAAVAKEAGVIVKMVSESASNIDLQSWNPLRRFEKYLSYVPFSEEDIRGKIQELIGRTGTFVAALAGSVAASIPTIGLNIIIFLLSFYYALVDGRSLSGYLEKCLPFGRSEISDIFSTTEKICRGVVLGSLVAGLAQGLVIGSGFALLGVPGALIVGAITMVLSFVPVLGCAPAGLGGIIYLLINGRQGAAITMLGITAVASVADNIVKPAVLKGAVELHPLLGLISALGGLALFGFVGLFLGPLLAAFVVVILDMISRRNQQHERN